MTTRRPLHAVVLLAGLLAGLGACGGVEGTSTATSPGDPEVDLSTGGGLDILQASMDAPWSTRFRGTRRVRIESGASPVEYLEEVGADGKGGFSIQALSLETPHSDENVFLSLLDLRQTLSYRFRDFSIKDWELFTQSYAVAILDEVRSVAGLPTVGFKVERMSDARSRYEIDVEPDTGMVLAYTELDAATGQLMTEVAYESIDFQPDLTGMVMVEFMYPTKKVSLVKGTLSQKFDFEPLVPKYLPPGYRMLEEMHRQEAPDGVRAKVFLTDGLEVIVLGSQKPLDTSHVTASRVVSTDLGTWTGIMGEVQGYPVLVAGKVDALEQSLVLQSAFE